MSMIIERYELSCDRIREIATSQETGERFREYFRKTAEFILQVVESYENLGKTKDIESLRAENRALYHDIYGDNYAVSYANPAYACEKLGEEYGQLLSFLYTELRAMIPYAFEAMQE